MLAPGARRLAFLYRPWPEPLLLDLAIQAAGLTAVPVVGPGDVGTLSPERWRRQVEARRPEGWVEIPQGPRLEGEFPWPGLPRRVLGEVPTERAPLPSGPAGGVVVGGGEIDGEELAAGTLAAAVARLESCIHSSRDRRAGQREILVSGRALDEPGERLLLAWAIAAGAALVLEPHAGSLVATAAWVRPTVFQGDAAELAALADAARRYRPAPLRRLLAFLLRRPPVLPFGRLHTLFCTEPPSDELIARWSGWGARVHGPSAAALDAAL